MTDLKDTAPPIQYVVLHMGYVESGRVAPLILQYQGGDPHVSQMQALADIALCLFHKYLEDTEYQRGVKLINRCCRESLAKAGPDDFHCTKCGGNIKPQQVNFDDFRGWIYDLPGRNADEWGEELENWWPWVSIGELLTAYSASKYAIFETRDSAEHLLVSLLESEYLEEEFRDALKDWQEEEQMDAESIAEQLSWYESD